MTPIVMVLCTINRTDEVRIFLDSLKKQQDPPPFSVIAVDQNPDDRLLPIFEEYGRFFPIKRLNSKPGLSRARNIGLAEVQKDAIVSFPDDDCTYPPELLRSVSDYFGSNAGCALISTRVTDENGSLSAGYMSMQPQKIVRGNVWRCGVSVSVFFRESMRCCDFDETLGVGSGTKFGSGEETDFLLNMIEHGLRMDYVPSMVVYHPCFTGPWRAKRGYLYGCGMGRVLRKHNYHILSVLYFASLQGIRACQFLLFLHFSRAFFHLAMAWGRVAGFFFRNK